MNTTHPSRRSLSAIRAVALVVLALGLLLASPRDRVLAHATLIASDPTDDAVLPLPPTRVTLTFAEPVDVQLSSIEVTTTNGQRMDRDDLMSHDGGRRLMVSLKPLERGTYIVDWKNVSTIDGHPLSGRFAFHVGERSSGALISKGAPTFPSPLEPPARFMLDAGLLVLVGTLSVTAFVVRPTRGEDPASSTALPRMVLAAAGLALVGAALQLTAQVAATEASPVDLLSGRWGTGYLVRAVALMATLLLAFVHRPRLALATALVALLSIAATSHGAAIRGLATPAIIADALHLAAVAIWVGGLPAVLLVLWTHRGERNELTATFRRFSTIALIAAGIAGVTGTYLAWLHVLNFSAFDNTYGRAVLAKVAFFAGLVVLGAVNRRWSLPSLQRGARHRLRLTLGIEVALGIGLVAAVAVMTSTLPAREALRPALPGGVTTTADGTRIEVRAGPGLPGANEVTIHVRDSRGGAVEGAAVAFHATPLGQQSDSPVTTTSAGPGTYQAPFVFGARGVWNVTVSVAPRAGFDASGSVRMEIGAAPPPRPAPSIAWGWKGFGWVLVIGGAFAAAVSDREWAWRGRSRSPWYGAGAAALGLVVLILVAPRFAEPTSLPAASPDTLALGQQVYEANCQRCHGAELAPTEAVADLRLHALMHADSYFLDLVRNGRPGTTMPAFRDSLSEKQIGAVLTYIQEEVRRLEAAKSASPLPTPAR